ncbi:MAG: hypothetical protein OXJ53_03225, partial [Gammaproteobacteria bacterium]|nr:hypothetical protein [Gammaproteobacteria bacterium]
VEAFGPNLPVDEVAAKANTIAYEILTGISPRVERLYGPLSGSKPPDLYGAG